MPFDDFPRFKDALVARIPDLNVDAGTESIEHPKRFPLTAKVEE